MIAQAPPFSEVSVSKAEWTGSMTEAKLLTSNGSIPKDCIMVLNSYSISMEG